MAVVIETTIGNVTIDLFLKERPKTCFNFIKLCKRKYFNYNLLFCVDRNFIAQTGDPTGSGKGGISLFGLIKGESYNFYEGEKMPNIRHDRLGLVSMAACGDNIYGSQFFFTLGEDLESLDGHHLVFGEVSEGMDVLEQLNQTLIDENKRPYQDILIAHTVILHDPFPDEELKDSFKNISPPSPLPPDYVFESTYIAADEQIQGDDLKSLVEIQEEIEAKEAMARATILEMVGDLPSADVAPPENVLFVCKLNAVTTSEDLEVIFSRFGKINNCEVIRDRVTGKSLQYAFIEFTNEKHCGDAYFKMDNVLIDDRRIHVDFSQSVSRIRWRGKGRGVEIFDDNGSKVEDGVRKNKILQEFEETNELSHKEAFVGMKIDNSKASDPLYVDKSSTGKSKRKDRIDESYARSSKRKDRKYERDERESEYRSKAREHISERKNVESEARDRVSSFAKNRDRYFDKGGDRNSDENAYQAVERNRSQNKNILESRDRKGKKLKTKRSLSPECKKNKKSRKEKRKKKNKAKKKDSSSSESSDSSDSSTTTSESDSSDPDSETKNIKKNQREKLIQNLKKELKKEKSRSRN